MLNMVALRLRFYWLPAISHSIWQNYLISHDNEALSEEHSMALPFRTSLFSCFVDCDCYWYPIAWPMGSNNQELNKLKSPQPHQAAKEKGKQASFLKKLPMPQVISEFMSSAEKGCGCLSE